MKRKDLYMVNTKIEAVQSIAEIQTYLIRMGATSIMTEFEDGEPSALYFKMNVDGKSIPFELPARVEPIYKIMHANRFSKDEGRDRAQAKRVAWRQVYRWVLIQVAMIETGMVDPAEVMFAYVQTGPKESLYKKAMTGGFQKLLPAPTES
jgi:hypothetical protein